MPREELAPSWGMWPQPGSPQGRRQTSRLSGPLTLNLWPPFCEGSSLWLWVTQRGHRSQQSWEAGTPGLQERGPTPCQDSWEWAGLTSRDVPPHSALASRGPERRSSESNGREPLGVQAPAGCTAPGSGASISQVGGPASWPLRPGVRGQARPVAPRGFSTPGTLRSQACPAWLCSRTEPGIRAPAPSWGAAPPAPSWETAPPPGGLCPRPEPASRAPA